MRLKPEENCSTAIVMESCERYFVSSFSSLKSVNIDGFLFENLEINSKGQMLHK